MGYLSRRAQWRAQAAEQRRQAANLLPPVGDMIAKEFLTAVRKANEDRRLQWNQGQTPIDRTREAIRQEMQADMARAIDHERAWGERWHGMLHQIAAVLELPEGYKLADIIPAIKYLQTEILGFRQIAERKDSHYVPGSVMHDVQQIKAALGVKDIGDVVWAIEQLKQQIKAGDEMVSTMDRLGLLKSHQDPLGQRPIEALERIRK